MSHRQSSTRSDGRGDRSATAPLWMLAALVFVSAVSRPVAAARTDPPGEASGPQATFTSGVELVRLDIRVVDAEGRPLRDLRREELEIRDGGKRLPIVLFQHVREPSGSYVDDVVLATTSEVSSNAAFPRGHLYILIFDQQHITPGNEHRARIAAEQFLRRRVRPSDRVALFAIPGPGPQIGFTSDTAHVLNEIGSIRGFYRRTVASPLGTMSVYEAHRISQRDDYLTAQVMERLGLEAGADIRPTGREDSAITRRLIEENARTIVNQTDSESRQFLQRVSDLIAGFRDVEGRKTVVLFSEGFFQDNLSRELEAVAAAAAQSYSVFYALDLNQRGVSAGDAAAVEPPLASEVQTRIAPLATLAVETDGELILDAAGRSSQVLDRIAEQAQEYYVVGFAAPDDARLERGTYRRVTVSVSRAGARASARTGYAVPRQPVAADRRRSINMALAAPFAQQGLRVDYTTYVLRAAAPGRQRVILSLSAELPVRAAPGDVADVVFVVRDARAGHVVASGTDTIALPAEPVEHASIGRGSWRVQFELPPGHFLMRAVVREPGGLMGSADRRLQIFPLDGPDVNVSDLVIGSTTSPVPVRPVAYTGDGLSGLIEMYARSASELEPVEVEVKLRRQTGGAPVMTAGAELRDTEQDHTGFRRQADILLPLGGIATGSYVVHAVVRARGEIVGERTRQVDVRSGTAPDRSTFTDMPDGGWTPSDVVESDLARRYLAWLGRQTSARPVVEALRLAALNQWEQVEIQARRAPEPGVASHALLGLALFARGEYASAVASLEQARTAAPNDALTAFFLGWAYEAASDSTAALGAWRGAVHLDPALVSGHLALAEGYLRRSELALAIQALRAGLTKVPSSPELRARLEQIERSRP